MISDSNAYTLFVTNHEFEVWLMMHFEDIDCALTKSSIYRKLEDWLRITAYKKVKANMDIIKNLVSDNVQVEKAVTNAEKLQNMYDAEDKSIYKNIKEMNPYTNIHTLIKPIMYEITKSKANIKSQSS